MNLIAYMTKVLLFLDQVRYHQKEKKGKEKKVSTLV